MADPSSLLVVLGQPFMQRALLGGLLTGALGGLLGSFAVLRQLSFFSDALGHSALLGISLGILLGVNPTLVLIPFAVLFALLVNQLVARSGLPADALLNIVYSTSLAFAVVALSLVETYRGGIQQLLFGDILGISWSDLSVIAVLLLGALIYLALSLRAQGCSPSTATWPEPSVWEPADTGWPSSCCWRWWWRCRSRRWGCC